MEYYVSKKEIDRRKTANLVVTFSLTVGFFLGLFKLWHSDLPQVLMFTGCFFVALWVLRILSMNVLDRHLKTKVILTDEFVRRISTRADDTITLDDIRRVYILKTTRGDVRHVKLFAGKGSAMVLNGMDRFQELVDQLKARVPNGAVQEAREPIDYDHPLFYYILGPVVGFAVTFGVQYVSTLNARGLAIAIGAFAGLAVCLGVYFLIAQPLKKGYGRKSAWGDIVFGLALFGIGALLILFAVGDLMSAE
ncbi:MAG: hypothetical protein PHY34_03105 [Patescibacteria group bacterium]|nr:hypothetical protein [Patescibacteria group bacterium]MDD5716136.1 hypothetical protein [Patescibacteria group bacterium]